MNAPPPAEAERRKARDAALRTQDEAIAEHLAHSMRSGELQAAPSYGRPMPEAEGWHETPAEFRMPFKILKNAGIAPPELALFHQRAALRAELEACADDAGRARLRQRLADLEQMLALRLEALRAGGRL